jgi:hypothetical protein
MNNPETAAIEVDATTIDTWADDLRGPVALHLRQKLRPVDDGSRNGADGFPGSFHQRTPWANAVNTRLMP